jgi:hypothetical protein
MKKMICSAFFTVLFCSVIAQQLIFKHQKHQATWGKAFDLAIWTMDTNTTSSGLLKAGAGYGGEWARDASMNSWNAASLLRPEVAEYSLWSVTKKKEIVDHQYWDKIVWIIAAENHYNTTGNKTFLNHAIKCAQNTFDELYKIAFNTKYNLFTGPGNINDGIAAYPEPVFEPNNLSSYVLDHKKSAEIMVLSTNLLYMQAHLALSNMLYIKNETKAAKAHYSAYLKLKHTIKKQFYLPKENAFNYLIYADGSKVKMQEGLGYSYALLFDILNNKEAEQLIKNTHLSPFGIVNVYPHLPRYNDSILGRHNYMVWAFINAYWGNAMAKYKNEAAFEFELNNQAALAIDADKGNMDFAEIANPFTGKPDGGWQSNRIWSIKHHQTWNATGYLSMITKGLFGITVKNGTLYIQPFVPVDVDEMKLHNIIIQDKKIHLIIKGKGSNCKWIKKNGKIIPSLGSFKSKNLAVFQKNNPFVSGLKIADLNNNDTIEIFVQ